MSELSIDLPQKKFECQINQPLQIPLKCQTTESQKGNLIWDVSRRDIAENFDQLLENKGNELKENKQQDEDTWILIFQFAGNYKLDIGVSDQTSGKTAKTCIQVCVAADERKLTIEALKIPPCIKGDSYNFELYGFGGFAPYTWTISGLPKGLDYSKKEGYSVQLSGLIPEVTVKNAEQDSDDLIIYNLQIQIKDKGQNICSINDRILVINPKHYCLIPEGKFKLGYHSTPEKTAMIEQMAEQHIRNTLIDEHARDPIINKIVKHSGYSIAESIRKQIEQTNQGSTIELNRFYIRKYPVTNADWLTFITATDYKIFPDHWDISMPYFASDEATLPIVNISYESICAYLQWKGTRLPNHREWERAARGIDGRLFPWGDDFDVEKCNVWDSWQRSGDLQTRVGHLKPVDSYDQYSSSEGVCDMVGNAAEWVDCRVYNQGGLYNSYRGGSFLDSCLYALTFRDSVEVGIRFGTNGTQEVGETCYPWLSFRDVIDLEEVYEQAQGLIKISARDIGDTETKIPVPDFQIARYAVSNFEYLNFVKASQWQKPEHWKKDDKYPFPKHHGYLPVVNVSYQDALAFCLWLSCQSGQIIRLPTAAQWHAARQGLAKHKYPWGETFEMHKCNLITSSWGKLVPVYELKDGQSQEGVYNLVGNAWEWIRRENSREGLRIIGGSWETDDKMFENQGFVMTVKLNSISTMASDIGFRYVRNYSGTEQK